ncbi:MAG: TRAP transporter small permease subunit [Myxococcota bacterium]|jgi:TRAP-type mannitol/chloroaromatic compound transport system permease small subunit|nr:TRAP transporter small permease subunit [Myxococcota bacterium]
MSTGRRALEAQLPHTRLSRRLDSLVTRIGDAVSWLWIVLLATIVTNVVMRYVFGEGRIEFEELQWHLYAIGFLSALSYGVVTDDHVRVDFARARMDVRVQAWVELYGILLLLFPFVVLVLHYAVPFIAYSWQTGEVSQAPGGLPYRWFIKGVLFAGFALLGLSAWSRLCRVWSFLFGTPPALPEDESP